MLERSSSRETAARVAVGAIARQLLSESASRSRLKSFVLARLRLQPISYLLMKGFRQFTEESPVRVVDKETEEKMTAYIDEIKAEGDSIGGNC